MIATPITLPDGTVINKVTITSAPLTLTATGTYGRAIFTYTLPFTVEPSDDQIDLTRVFEANTAGTATVTFVAGPGGGAQALLDNLFSVLFIGQINTNVLAIMTNKLNTLAAAAAAAAVGALGFTGGLPPGVNPGRALGQVRGEQRPRRVAGHRDIRFPRGQVSRRHRQQNRSRVSLRPRPSGRMLRNSACLENAERRIYLPRRAGRLFVCAYEFVSPPLARVVSRSPLLRRATRRLLIKPMAVLIQRYTRRG